jgi:hypothetical protein
MRARVAWYLLGKAGPAVGFRGLGAVGPTRCGQGRLDRDAVKRPAHILLDWRFAGVHYFTDHATMLSRFLGVAHH